jgi:hypothetical protein
MDNESKRPHIIIKNEMSPAVKREYEGGGGGTHLRESYARHARKVFNEVDRIRAMFAHINDGSIENRYMKVSLPQGHKVSTSEGKIVEQDIYSNIVGSPAENVAHVSINKSAFEDLHSEIDRYATSEKHVGKSKFAIIEELSEIPFAEKISERFSNFFRSDEDTGEAIISLFSDLSQNDVDAILRAVNDFLRLNHSQILNVVKADSGTLFRVKSKKSVLKELSAKFISIQSLDASDDLISEMSLPGENVGDQVVVQPNSSRALACMFDTGINSTSRLFKDSVMDSIHPFGNNNGVGIQHGTFVASRIIYGDSIKDQLSTGVLTPDVRLVSVCINKFDDLGNIRKASIDELIEVIRSQVERLHSTIRVYNLSISCVPPKQGLSPSIKDDMVHILAAEIDAISRKYDVLFVICTGNIPFAPSDPFPTSVFPQYFDADTTRIMPPGEAMLALTVGSYALYDAAGSMDKKEDPSPFTRRGPGFANYYKPDLIAHGGNCGASWSEHAFLNVAGFSSHSEAICYGRGTSYAAPIVTRLAAKIFEIFPEAYACLVKALLIHFSRPMKGGTVTDESLLDLLSGHGAPAPELMMSSTKNRQSYIYQGELDFRDMVEVPFFVPSVLINRQIKEKVTVYVTICFYPETSASLKTGYCKSHIRTKLVKLNTAGDFVDIPFSKSSTMEENRYSTVIKLKRHFAPVLRLESGSCLLLMNLDGR